MKIRATATQLFGACGKSTWRGQPEEDACSFFIVFYNKECCSLFGSLLPLFGTAAAGSYFWFRTMENLDIDI